MHFSTPYSKKPELLQNIIFNQSNDTNIKEIDAISFKLNRIKFFIFLILQFLAVPCFLYAFYRYIYKKRLRKTIHYHVIYFLLFISFLFITMTLPLTQIYMFKSYVYPSNDIFCSFWNWFHYSLNIINLFLMAFLSIERNILIFHSNILRTKRAKILFHYCPILFCLFYPPIFYIGAIFICPCRNTYDYSQLLCTWPCYFTNKSWSTIDLFLNNYTPLCIIPIFCAILYIRVFLQRRSIQRQVATWRRNRRLVLQLWAISTLYLVTWMPLQISGVINLYWNPFFLAKFQIDYMYLFPYLIHIIYPFIVLFIIRSKYIQRNH